MREHSLFFVPFLSNYFQILKIHYQRPPIALLSQALSVPPLAINYLVSLMALLIKISSSISQNFNVFLIFQYYIRHKCRSMRHKPNYQPFHCTCHHYDLSPSKNELMSNEQSISCTTRRDQDSSLAEYSSPTQVCSTGYPHKYQDKHQMGNT